MSTVVEADHKTARCIGGVGQSSRTFGWLEQDSLESVVRLRVHRWADPGQSRACRSEQQFLDRLLDRGCITVVVGLLSCPWVTLTANQRACVCVYSCHLSNTP